MLKTFLGRGWFAPATALAVFGAVFCGPVQELNAAPAGCVLYVEQKATENEAYWRQLGFTLEERPDLRHMGPEAKSQLLNDSRFALVRGPNAKMWMSFTRGQPAANWEPVTFAIPNTNSPPDRRYACAALTKRMDLYRESRVAVEDVLKLWRGQNIGRTRGEAILDLERSYFVQNGVGRFERTNAKALYLKLLERVKEHATYASGDFKAAWLKVKKEIYGKDALAIRYCRTKASMTEALVDRCTNCAGETFLLAALFLDSGFGQFTSQKLYLENFSDHILPGLYDTSTGKVYDLVTGKTHPIKSVLLPEENLYRALLAGDTHLRFAKERTAIAGHSTNVIYSSWSCRIYALTHNFIYQRGEHEPGTWDQPSCAAFSASEPPDTASNENKLIEDQDDVEAGPSEDKPSTDAAKTKNKKEEGTGEDDGKNDASGSKASSGRTMGLFEALAAAFNGLKNGVGDFAFFSGGSTTYFASRYSKEGLGELAETLNPEEREIMLEVLRKKEWTASGVRHFSQGALLSAFNVTAPNVRSKDLDDVNHIEFIIPQKEERIFKFDDCISRHGRMGAKCVYLPPEYFERLKALSSIQRTQRLIGFVRDRFESELASLNARLKGLTNLEDYLDAFENEAFAAQSARAVLSLHSFYDWVGSFTRWDEDVDPKWITPRVVRRVLFQHEVMEFAQHILRIHKLVDDHTVSAARAAERALRSRPRAGALKSLFSVTSTGLSILHRLTFRQNSGLPEVQRYIVPMRDYVGNSNNLLGKFLYNVLTDDNYFFTVEADPDEKPALRPRYPLQIWDARVRDRKNESPPRDVPEINLPTLAGVECTPGMRGWYTRGSFQFECAPAPSGRGESGSDDRTQEGLETGREQGAAKGQPRGDRAENREGVIRDETEGWESTGRKILTRPLNDREKTYRPSDYVNDIQHGSLTPTDATLMVEDPRQEVHLSVDFWAWLLSSNMSSSSGTFDDPKFKVLLHHVYRRKLLRVYDGLAASRAFRFIEPADYLLKVAHWDRDRFREALHSPFESLSVNSRRLKAVDGFRGLGAKPYFRAAIAELAEPKTNYVVLSPTGSVTSEQQMMDVLDRLPPERSDDKRQRLPLPGIQTSFFALERDGTAQLIFFNSGPGRMSWNINGNTYEFTFQDGRDQTVFEKSFVAVIVSSFFGDDYLVMYRISPTGSLVERPFSPDEFELVRKRMLEQQRRMRILH